MERRPISPMVPVLAALVVCGAVIFVITGSRNGGGQDEAASTTATSTTTTSTASTTTPSVTAPPTSAPPAPVPIGTIAAEPLPENPPDSYRITYDVVESGLPRTETITVVRPFESLVVSTHDGDMVSGTATSRSRLWTYLTDRNGWLVIQPELHRAAYDQRPLAAMATMVALGRAEEQGSGEFLGRACRIFVTGQPLTNPGSTAPSDAESTEVCIDDRGLVLHELWQLNGAPVTERTATDVAVGIDADPSIFDPTPEIADAPEFEAVLSTVAVPADDATIAKLQVDITPPPGYELVGTVLRSGSPDEGAAASEIVRFYSDGSDLIELAEVTVPSGAQLDGTNAVPIEIKGPETWFVPDFRASVIRTRLSDTTFVELRGSNPAQLAALLPTMTSR